MDRRSAFLKCMNSEICREKDWIIRGFAVDIEGSPEAKEGMVRKHKGKGEIYLEGEWVPLTGTTSDSPIFVFKEPLVLETGDLLNVTGKTETSYGTALINQLILCLHVGAAIPYQPGNWLKDRRVDFILDEIISNDKISDEGAHGVCDALDFIGGLTQLCVPSATPKTMMTDPGIPKRRKELIAENKDRLNDPAVVSGIEQELIQMDREFLKGDEAEGFYKSGKAYNITRKRSYVMHGGERSFIDDNKMVVVPTSLQEGWDMKYLPDYSNSLRDGAHGRGAATAVGGERVKGIQRSTQNINVKGTDCKTKVGAKILVQEYNYKAYVGRYQMVGAEIQLLDEAKLKQQIGKVISIRSPGYCKTGKPDMCQVCAGTGLSKTPQSTSLLASTIGSKFMDLAMQKTHGKALLTTTYNIETELT